MDNPIPSAMVCFDEKDRRAVLDELREEVAKEFIDKIKGGE